MNKYLFLFLVGVFCSFTVFGADLYWVGGSGNWSDINHWRTSSGGTTLPNVVPGPVDNVFFDANSGFTAASKTITIEVAANCHDITFAGSAVPPILTTIPNQTLNVYGSSVWQSGMTVDVTNLSYQNTGEPKTITTNGVFTKVSWIRFYETSSISLLDDLRSSSRIFLYVGTFNTNSFRVDIEYFEMQSTNKPQILNLGSSQIYLSNKFSVFDTNRTRATVNAGTSHIHFTEALYSGSGIRANSSQVYHDMTFEDPMSVGGISGGATFNRVEFKGNGALADNNTFNELIFAVGKSYSLPRDKTQTIRQKFLAGKACSGWTTITSPSASAISMPAGATVEVAGAIMKNIQARGGANFVADSSIDNGGNTGWTFITADVSNLYWVGGAGNYTDPAHWSLSSGGAGGACVPGPGSNVFFDVNSGFTATSKTVTIDSESYCHDITFAGSEVPPIFISLDNLKFNIYGSSVWQRGMQVRFSSVFYQDTGEPKTITSNGVPIQAPLDITFNETTSVSLLDDLNAKSSLYIHAGTFNTNNFRLDVDRTFRAAPLPPPAPQTQITLNLGSSQIYMHSSMAEFTTSSLASFTAIINAGTSHIHFVDALSRDGMYTSVGQTYYDVTFENSNSTGAKLAGGASYNRVEFKGKGNFFNASTINELVLASGKSYTFQNNNTITILKRLLAGTVCSGWTTITSSSGGVPATISMPAGAEVSIAGVVLKDMKAIGGANFLAEGSIDNGGNSGWTFTPSASIDLYWVGGAGKYNDPAHWALSSGGVGGACAPGPGSNVFFDANSGFTAGSKTVTVDSDSYCHNITFSGAAVPPTITSTSSTFNIYGSSVWQTGMTIDLLTINYQNTGTPKTITSNGVATGSKGRLGLVNFYETSSISLLDDFECKSDLNVYGSWNTNNFRVDLNMDFSAAAANTPLTINLGSSSIYQRGTAFSTSSEFVTVNAGTSHIYVLGTLFFNVYPGQIYNDVTFEVINGRSTIQGGGIFNRVIFRGGGILLRDNTFNELFLLGKMLYTLASGSTQTVKTNLEMSGTPCNILTIVSSISGRQANLNVLAGNTTYNFVNMKDINASGQKLYFKKQSTIDKQNNTNVEFEPYDPGALEGLGPDWLCHTFNDNDSSSYMLSAEGFFGSDYTKYLWTKLDSPHPTEVIGTDVAIDLRKFGYGTYKVAVTYFNGATTTCNVSDEILIQKTPPLPVTDSVEICMKKINRLSDIGIAGENIKWYATATSSDVLADDTVLVDGATYYGTQTIDNCESVRTAVTVKLVRCDKAVYINPGIRLRVQH